MGQSVVVENVGGAGGSLGADQIAKAAPDGYTLLFDNLTFSTTTSSLLYARRARHDIENDFMPISVGAYVPMLLMVHPSVPANDLKEFVAYAKDAKDADVLRLDRSGQHDELIPASLLKRDAQIKLDHVPFRGAAPLVTELLSGRIQFGGDQFSTSLQRAKSGCAAVARGTERDQVGCAARRPDGARAGLRHPRIAGLERLLRAGRHARRHRAAAQQGDRRGRRKIRTCAPRMERSAPSRRLNRRTKCARCCASRSERLSR